MGLLDKLRRRWRIVRHIAEETQSAEQYFPYAALTGIGFNAVWWAAVEHQLDLLVYWHAYTRSGDNRSEHPRALVNKLRYLKIIEKDESLSTDVRARIRALRLKIAEISELRHDFTHSFMDIATPQADWPFSRLRYEGKRIYVERKIYDIDQLAKLTNDIRQLVDEISPLLEDLALPWLNSNKSLFTNSSAEKPRP